MSVNIIEGPGPSSVATRVTGTGLLLNFGVEAWRDNGGRSECEEGRRGEYLLFSLRDGELLVKPRPPEERAGVVGLTMKAGLEAVGWGIVDRRGVDSEAVALDSAIVVDRGVRSGTFTSFSPVDFLDTGGPRIESP